MSARAACVIPQAQKPAPAGTCKCSNSPAGSSNAVTLVGDAADGMPTMPGIPRAAAHGNADADNDNNNDADVGTPATPAPISAGRCAATYELECIHMRQKMDAQRNTTNNLEPDIVKIST
eukprot:708254-Pleurochrysis_carterae.AAC.1